MKVYVDLPQHLEDGTANPDWLAVRGGLFTGSDFAQYLPIVEKGKISDTAESNLHKKVFESLGYSFDGYKSAAMEQGTEFEPIARQLYKETSFNDVQEVGFVDWEKMRAGCSPDGVIYDDMVIIDPEPEFPKITKAQALFIKSEKPKIKKIIEIKCPEIKNYLKLAKGDLPPQYACQVQFNMLITGAKSCDFVVWHPDMQLVVREILADADFQERIIAALEKLNTRYDEILAEIEQYRKKD